MHRLKRIIKGDKSLDTSELENDFLAFSAYSSSRELTVKEPMLYPLRDEEIQHFRKAMAASGYSSEAPEAIDISGGFSYTKGLDTLIFTSLRQLNADHLLDDRSYLNPLIEKVYSEGILLVRDFAVHESLYGRVTAKSGGLDLREVHIFPEKFRPGPYTLQVELDTPSKTVRKFRELHEELDQFTEQPKSFMLDSSKIDLVTKKAINLRKLLGSLSRYERPETQKYQIETNSCLIRNGSGTQFYLYSPQQHRNVLVYFGGSPFSENKQPRDLLVLDGERHQYTLAELAKLDFFQPSQPVLQRRIEELNALYENAARAMDRRLEHTTFEKLIEKLQGVKRTFQETINEKMRNEIIRKQSPELLEFIVYPNTEDPIIHELLPRLSWKSSLRQYHDTPDFIERFERADEAQREELLNAVLSNLVFSNQQNNDVNRWLEHNHGDFCEEQGIVFVEE